MRRFLAFTLPALALGVGLGFAPAAAQPGETGPRGGWQQPGDDILAVLHAPELPIVWTAPGGAHLLLADPVVYPSLAELAAPMHKLAGIRVNPKLNAVHGWHGGTGPRLMAVEGGESVALELPVGAEVHSVDWTADGRRFALTVAHDDHLGLWVSRAMWSAPERTSSASTCPVRTCPASTSGPRIWPTPTCRAPT
jgi:hypothetical protein